MRRLIRLAGYVILVATPLALLARGFVADASALAVGLQGGLVLFGGVAAVTERQRAFAEPVRTNFGRADVADALAVAVAAVVTYLLSVHVGLGPVRASALVGLVAGVAAPEIDASAYCGSFVGMASAALFPSVGYLAVAGGLSGVAFVASKRTFDGFGGKLGTLALFGCATTATLTGADYASGTAVSWSVAALVVPAAVAAAVVTVVLSVRFDLGAVVGSSLVGLAAGLALPALVADLGGTLAVAAFCASFVGMSSPERLDGEVPVALAGGLSGAVFVAVSAALSGAGGKLGTIAFVSCVAVAGAERLFAGRV